LLLDCGDRPQAAVLLTEARQLLDAFPDGAGAQLDRLYRVERRLTGRPPDMPPAGLLTERETAVLGLLGGSLSLREIGRELHVSQNTVKTHIRAIYRKLGVSTRHDAIAASQDIADSSGDSGAASQVVEPG
jgi:LuxR family maltose regulon positive regulatory protein